MFAFHPHVVCTVVALLVSVSADLQAQTLRTLTLPGCATPYTEDDADRDRVTLAMSELHRELNVVKAKRIETKLYRLDTNCDAIAALGDIQVALTAAGFDSKPVRTSAHARDRIERWQRGRAVAIGIRLISWNDAIRYLILTERS
ncbi:MAG: hypothetical protein ACRCWJ_11190 [Casimicrobium sp.]